MHPSSHTNTPIHAILLCDRRLPRGDLDLSSPVLTHIHAARRTGSGCDTTSDISQPRHVPRRTADTLFSTFNAIPAANYYPV
jgi:hypothetical protein